jgi:hypothetical protein
MTDINGNNAGVSEVEVSATGDQPVREVNATEAFARTKTFKDVDRTKIKADLVRNPRDPKVYKDGRNKFLARAIYDFGLAEDLWVSLRADGFYWILRGHRRFAAIETICNEGLEAVADDPTKPAVPADPTRFAKIKCIVYRGLTPDEELDLVMDHGGVVKLSKQEQFLAAKTMASYGWTHALIAPKLGMTRANYTNGLAKLMLMPQVVQDTFLSTEKDAPSMSQKTIQLLATEFDKDQKLPGARLRTAGPNFNASWEKFLKEGNTTPDKGMDRAGLAALMVNLNPGSSDQDIIDLIQAIHDNNGMNAATSINRLKALLKIARPETFTRIEEGIPATVGSFTEVEDD